MKTAAEASVFRFSVRAHNSVIKVILGKYRSLS